MSAPEPGPSERMNLTGRWGQVCAAAGTAATRRMIQAVNRAIFIVCSSLLPKIYLLERPMSTISKVGILGLGKMGAPMARHLLAKGFNVLGFDPVDAARAAAARLGVAVAASPADVARASELVI